MSHGEGVDAPGPFCMEPEEPLAGVDLKDSSSAACTSLPHCAAGCLVSSNACGTEAQLCRTYTMFGQCGYGTDCSYAHGLNELRPPPRKWEMAKTDIPNGTDATELFRHALRQQEVDTLPTWAKEWVQLYGGTPAAASEPPPKARPQPPATWAPQASGASSSFGGRPADMPQEGKPKPKEGDSPQDASVASVAPNSGLPGAVKPDGPMTEDSMPGGPGPTHPKDIIPDKAGPTWRAVLNTLQSTSAGVLPCCCGSICGKCNIMCGLTLFLAGECLVLGGGRDTAALDPSTTAEASADPPNLESGPSCPGCVASSKGSEPAQP